MSSTTVSSYLNAIPATWPEYPLAKSILAKITVASGTSAPACSAQHELPGLLNQLLQSLIDRKRLTPATLLAIAATVGVGALADVGITGSVTLGSNSITVSAGAY